jgi:hypothetical protein
MVACTLRIAAVSIAIQAIQPARRSSRPRCLVRAIPARTLMTHQPSVSL